MVNLDYLITEGANPATAAIDSMSTREIVALINAEDARVASAVAAVGEEIALLVDVVVSRLEDGGRLIYVGAGTSGRLGVLDAAECPPTFNTAPEEIVGVIAGGHTALTHAVEAVEDDPAQGKHDVAALDVGPNDVVLGIAASGRTPYVLGAVAEAGARSAFPAGLACTAPSPLADMVQIMIAPIVGPEVITGSTRMKAGTAQKMVLNTLTTATMIRLGKTFGNLMIDVQPTNAKLRQRAVRIVAMATGVEQNEALRLLAAADGEVKTAIVVALAHIDVAHARQRLAANRGIVRQAINNG